MVITYKIPYEVYADYFFGYRGFEAKMSLYIEKFLSYFKNKPTIFFALTLFILFAAFTVLLNAIIQLMVFIILGIISMLISVPLKFSFNPFSFQSMQVLTTLILFVSIFFIAISIYRILKFEMPFVLRDMINDRELIKKNIGEKMHPFEINRFSILAYLKNDTDVDGLYKYIPGFTKAGSLSEAKKQLKLAKIQGISIITEDIKYVPWNFEIEKYENKITPEEKKNIENTLIVLWDSYLDREYDKIKRRMKEKNKSFHSD